MRKIIIFTISLLVVLVIIPACSSGGTNPTTPQNPSDNGNGNNNNPPQIPVISLGPGALPGPSRETINPDIPGDDDDDQKREILGVWKFDFDFDNLTATVSSERLPQIHLDVTLKVPKPDITVHSWDPVNNILNFDVLLSNPYQEIVYDVRAIIFTNERGHLLLNADAWTNLYDIYYGELINPFKAYAKTEPDRVFGSKTSYSENFQVYFPEGVHDVYFAVDCSYPSNCEEPYAIENLTQERLLGFEGAKAKVDVDILDWQNDTGQVYLNCPAITNEILSSFIHGSGSDWELTIENATGAKAGTYDGWIIAMESIFSYVALYLPVKITIDEVVVEGWADTWQTRDLNINGIAVAKDGNIYLAGCFEDTVDFDPGPEQVLKSATGSYGNVDAFLCKIDSSGDLKWVNTWGGIGCDQAASVCIDKNGYIYVAGSFDNSFDFDPGPGTWFLSSQGYYDMFISKFNPNGGLVHASAIGGLDSDHCYKICSDGTQFLYITGFSEEGCDFDPGPGGGQIPNNGLEDAFVAKYDLNIDFIWVKGWGSESSDRGYDVSVDLNNEVYVTGYFNDTVDFNPGPDSLFISSNGGEDVYLSKFNSHGDFLWAKTWGGTGNDYGQCIDVDSQGNAFVGGNFELTVDFDPGSGTSYRTQIVAPDMFISKFVPNGDLEWVITDDPEIRDLCSDGANGIYATGYYNGVLEFSSCSDTLISNGSRDIFFTRLDSSGNCLFVQSWGGNAGDQGNAICTDSLKYPFIAGESDSDFVDFDPGPDFDYRNGESQFVIKTKPDGFWY